MYAIVQTIPKATSHANTDGNTKPPPETAYSKARNAAYKRIDVDVRKFEAGLSEEMRELCQDAETFAEEVAKALPDARLLLYVDQFFTDTYGQLSEKTRSIVDFSFSGFLYRLLREPFFSLFCKDASTFTPEDSLQGKIILLNLPVKLYHKVGRDCQILFKYIWQRAMEKRNMAQNGRPVFLWADEAQNFLHEHDADFQATARSSRVATVYLSQNLPNYYANMGGVNGEFKVKSFLGTLARRETGLYELCVFGFGGVKA